MKRVKNILVILISLFCFIVADAAKVSIGENGNIILSDGVFFDHGSADIKPESEKVLNELIDVFSSFLQNPEILSERYKQ